MSASLVKTQFLKLAHKQISEFYSLRALEGQKERDESLRSCSRATRSVSSLSFKPNQTLRMSAFKPSAEKPDNSSFFFFIPLSEAPDHHKIYQTQGSLHPHAMQFFTLYNVLIATVLCLFWQYTRWDNCREDEQCMVSSQILVTVDRWWTGPSLPTQCAFSLFTASAWWLGYHNQRRTFSDLNPWIHPLSDMQPIRAD